MIINQKYKTRNTWLEKQELEIQELVIKDQKFRNWKWKTRNTGLKIQDWKWRNLDYEKWKYRSGNLTLCHIIPNTRLMCTETPCEVHKLRAIFLLRFISVPSLSAALGPGRKQYWQLLSNFAFQLVNGFICIKHCWCVYDQNSTVNK